MPLLGGLGYSIDMCWHWMFVKHVYRIWREGSAVTRLVPVRHWAQHCKEEIVLLPGISGSRWRSGGKAEQLQGGEEVGWSPAPPDPQQGGSHVCVGKIQDQI